MRNRRPRRPWKRSLIDVAVLSGLVPQLAVANPTAPAVVHGSVAFSRQGGVLTVTNSPSAIINWQTFSINPGELTRFIQQSAQSAVLNRVVGQHPSQILGALQSNGRVFIVNPSGIVFGSGSQIDVAGLVASSLKLSDADFLAGRLKFTDAPGAGAVVNQGAIVTPRGGTVYLIAPQVENSGIIVSPHGEIVLAAGRSVELVDAGSPNLRVEITAPADAVVNLGEALAQGGRVAFAASAIRQDGVVNADSAVVDESGRILLKASGGVALGAGSRTSASGPSGGSVSVQAGDTALISGTVEAKGSAGNGGTIHLLGDKVGLLGAAAVDASGAGGGGTVLVGGDLHGGNPGVRNASAAFFGPDATIRVDATERGDGGRAIVWSDGTTRAYGAISARGGIAGGDGGFVEVSGKRSLDYRARANVGASSGRGGTLLLDPSDITLVGAGGTLDPELNGSADPNILFADGGVANTLSVAELTAGFGAGDTIVLEATNNINVSTSFTLQPGVNLTLRPNADGIGGGAFNFSGGTIGISNGTLALSPNSVMNWSNGDLLGTSVAGSTFSVPAGATVNITNSANNHRMNTLTVNNAGTWNVQTGNATWQWENGAQFNNLASGIVDFQTDGSTIGTFTTGGRITNQGIWKKSGGVGTTSFGATNVAFDNAGGSVSVTSGTLQLNSGGNHSGTTTLSGNVQFNLGTHAFASGSVIDGPFNVNGATVNATDATINGTFGLSGGSNVNIGAGTLALGPAATMNWSNGNLVGATVPGSTFSVPAGATVNITNSANNHRMNTLTVNNAGTWNVQTGNGTWQWDNGAQFNNLAGGVVDFQADGNTIGSLTNGGRISNQGTWKKSGGVGTTSFGATTVAFDNAGGSVSVTSGTLQLNSGGNHSGTTTLSGNVQFNLGTHAFAPGSVIDGPFNVSGATVNVTDATINGTFGLSGGSNVNIGTGTLALGPAATMNWSNGNLVGASVPGSVFSVPAGATVNITNSANNHRMNTLTVNNAGTWNVQTGNGTWQWDNGAQFNNLAGGIVDLQTDGSTIGTFTNGGRISNQGTWKKSGGVGTSSFGATNVAFDNAGGSVSATSGTLQLNSGGNHSGSMNLDGNVVFSGGTHAFSGTVTVPAGSSLNVAGATMNFGDGSVLDLANNLNFTSGSINIVGNGAGTTIAAGSTLTLSSGSFGGAGKLANLGTFNLAAGNVSARVVNQGNMNVASGVATFDGASFDQNGGTLSIAGGATLNKNGGAFDWTGGTLAGAGTLTMAGGASFGLVGNGARVLNGLTLNVAGLTVPGGSLTVQAGTINAGGVTTVAPGALLDVTGGTFNAAGATVNVDGTLHAGGGAISAGTMNVNTGGMLSGTGTITGNVVNAGTVAPGNSPGILTVDGNYTQGAGGTLAIEIGGLLPGADYDRLAVTGTASLNGTLGVSLTGGFTPGASDVFRVLTAAAGVNGNFSTVTLPAGYTPNVGYLPLAVDLGLTPIVVPPPVVPPPVVVPPPAPPIAPVAVETPPAGLDPERDVVAGLDRATRRVLPGPVEGETFDLLYCD
ncbi:MAG: filamentous hemagglutinin N-terminal domain-containing protein [Gammaproteobacteria bacterium]|nr:filamentous hemagglutinin N-terminal domain-containing protein [Gammaproteobacteria bacterium]